VTRTRMLFGVLLAAITSLGTPPLCLAQAKVVPTPEQHLGHPVGADRKLVPWSKIEAYFRKLGDNSDRVRIEDIGLSSEGRRMILAVIAAPQTLEQLGQHKQNQRKLADPRLIKDDAEKRRLIDTSKVVILIGCSIHASEVAGSQTALELVHYLATSNSPEVREILDKAIMLLVPSTNPDGTDIVHDWYTKSLGKPWEGGGLPWLYHKYAGHDNNRDWFMLNLAETRNLTKVLYRQWFPTIVLDVHQMGSTGPRQFVPPYFGPINPNIHPVIHQSVGMIGAHQALDLARNNKKGVVHSAMFDLWWSGSFSSTPRMHNMVSVLSETATTGKLATPGFFKREQLKGGARGLPEYAPATNFSDPWPGGAWKLRDAVDYQLIVAKSLLSSGARFREQFQANYVKLGEEAIRKGQEGKPYAWIVSPIHQDYAAMHRMLRILHDSGIEIHAAGEEFQADGVKHLPGTLILFAAQPYRAHLKDMLEVQRYPKRMTAGGQPERPYDVTGWTLPLQMGVHCVEVSQPFELKHKTKVENLAASTQIRGGAKNPAAYLVLATSNDDYRFMNRLHASGIKFEVQTRWTDKLQLLDLAYSPAGFILAPTNPKMKDELPIPLYGVSLNYRGVTEKELGMLREFARVAPASRLALYQPWFPSMDEGWTRLVLEQFEFPYTSLHNEGVLAGKLRERFDCIILPSITARSILSGQSAKMTDPKYAGGIGTKGVGHLKDFVKTGGTLVCIDDSCNLPIQYFGIPVRNVLADETGTALLTKDFFCPGSIVGVTLDPKHPLSWGRPEKLSAYFARSQAFDAMADKDGIKAQVVARYADKDVLQSGFLLGEKHIAGKAAIVDVSYGKGQTVLFGFRVQNRAQPHGTFRLLFNAIHGSTIPRPRV
jgi:hypothetical protein